MPTTVNKPGSPRKNFHHLQAKERVHCSQKAYQKYNLFLINYDFLVTNEFLTICYFFLIFSDKKIAKVKKTHYKKI